MAKSGSKIMKDAASVHKQGGSRLKWAYKDTESPQSKKAIEKAKIAYGAKGSGTKVSTKPIRSGSGQKGSMLTMEISTPAKRRANMKAGKVK